tara:strand:+ start:55 stop:852 length:798 start_codon:yes stop_codon:yes gene_type:complete
MKTIKDNSIDLWVTSPPYAKQRDYNGADSKSYLEFISPILLEAKRTLNENGSIFFNIKEHCKNGQRDLYVYKMVIHFVENLGLRLVDEFIWNKTNPFPTGAKTRLKDGFERVYHFTKSKKHNFYPENVLVKSTSKWLESEKRRKNKGEHNVTNGSGMNMQKRIATDLVRPSNVITGTSSNENIGHPAVYPTYFAEFFVKVGSAEGMTVGDMFMGSGTTAISCMNTNRKFIGIELDEKYYEIAKKRVEEKRKEKDLQAQTLFGTQN